MSLASDIALANEWIGAASEHAELLELSRGLCVDLIAGDVNPGEIASARDQLAERWRDLREFVTELNQRMRPESREAPAAEVEGFLF